MYRRGLLLRQGGTPSFSPFGMTDRSRTTQQAAARTSTEQSIFQRSRSRQSQQGASAKSGSSTKSTFSTGSAIHMYANKEGAWEGHTDDRFYGAKRFKEYWHRILNDRGAKYYIFGMIILILGSSAKLWQMQNDQLRDQGLIGPPKKKYRSRLTVVLDVDETILSYGDKAFRMKAGLVARPYLAELLDYLSSIDAEVVLWGGCSERYMRQVLNVIDPAGVRISNYITRDASWHSQDKFYEKNLFWLNRPMENVLMIENRPLSIRNCNANAILVNDFIRGEYMDTGQDYPPNDHALRTVMEIIQDLEVSGRPVADYLNDTKKRHAELKEIPCHLAFRQLPDELARGVFFFLGDKYNSVSSPR